MSRGTLSHQSLWLSISPAELRTHAVMDNRRDHAMFLTLSAALAEISYSSLGDAGLVLDAIWTHRRSIVPLTIVKYTAWKIKKTSRLSILIIFSYHRICRFHSLSSLRIESKLLMQYSWAHHGVVQATICCQNTLSSTSIRSLTRSFRSQQNSLAIWCFSYPKIHLYRSWYKLCFRTTKSCQTLKTS